MTKRLPHLRSALGRLLPGRDNAYARMLLRRRAENEAGRPDHGVAEVHDAMHFHHADRLTPFGWGEVKKALERDLPAPPAEEGGTAAC